VSDINVTPLVDVTLVLLIIFMISAPFMRSGIRVDLPKAEARQPQPQRSIIISIDRAGQTFVNQTRVEEEALVPTIARMRSRSAEMPILVEGDAAVPYGRVIAVMDAVRRAGIENVGLVLDAPEKP
jgi:TolR protein